MIKPASIALFAVVVSLAVPALAQTPPAGGEIQALRSALQSDKKKAYVASALQLNDAEAKKFWPIYDDYQLRLDMNNRRRTRAVEDALIADRPISDLYARRMATELLAVEDAEVKALQKLFNQIVKVLPAKKAVRYLQIETKVNAIEEYDIASAIPLVK